MRSLVFVIVVLMVVSSCSTTTQGKAATKGRRILTFCMDQLDRLEKPLPKDANRAVLYFLPEGVSVSFAHGPVGIFDRVTNTSRMILDCGVSDTNPPQLWYLAKTLGKIFVRKPGAERLEVSVVGYRVVVFKRINGKFRYYGSKIFVPKELKWLNPDNFEKQRSKSWVSDQESMAQINGVRLD